MPPPPPLLAHYRTHDVAPESRLDAWREIAHRWVDFRPAPEVPLDAEMTILAGADCTFGTTRSSAYEMGTGAHAAQPDDMVVLTLIQAGELLPQDHPRKGPGALSLCALREAGQFRWGQDTRQAYLALPRRQARAMLGREPETELVSTRAALAPLLASQMHHLALLLRQPQQLDDAERAGLLEATRSLALLTLHSLGRHSGPADAVGGAEALHAGRRAAALRVMEQQAHRPKLDAAAIARAAGCSRTRLYEAFAARDQTVMGTLRELRLQRARSHIEQAVRLNVGALAWRCGFADASGFSKLFRARFGLSPTEWHRHASAARTG